MSFDAEDLYAILAVRRELDRREIGDDVRRDVGMRIAHLVEKLLFDRLDVYAAPRALMFGDYERAIG